MHVSKLPLNALRAFEAAARHLSFSRAAEELHVTPSALSHQVSGLEDLLDLPDLEDLSGQSVKWQSMLIQCSTSCFLTNCRDIDHLQSEHFRCRLQMDHLMLNLNRLR